MNYIYVIGDLHFGHEMMAKLRGYPTVEAHDEDLIQRWNAVVLKKDTVWVLGDAVFGRVNLPKLAALKGNKKLVMGNHDHYPPALYQEYFTRIAGVVEIHNCVLTHIPVHPGQFHRYRLNVHGHLHGYKLDDSRYIGVSAEQVNYQPVKLLEVIHRQ